MTKTDIFFYTFISLLYQFLQIPTILPGCQHQLLFHSFSIIIRKRMKILAIATLITNQINKIIDCIASTRIIPYTSNISKAVCSPTTTTRTLNITKKSEFAKTNDANYNSLNGAKKRERQSSPHDIGSAAWVDLTSDMLFSWTTSLEQAS